MSAVAWRMLVCAVAWSASAARADDDPWFARDKALHFGACTVLGAGGYGLSSLWLARPYQRALTGGAFAVGVGALKEGLDATGFGDPSWRDFTWDVAGAAFGVGLAYTIDFLVNLNASGEPQERSTGAVFRF